MATILFVHLNRANAMDAAFQNKSVLVTAAASGIGLASILRLVSLQRASVAG